MSGHGQVLTCYKCASGVSWRECAYKQHETKCSKENDKCMTVEFRGKYGEAGFVRSVQVIISNNSFGGWRGQRNSANHNYRKQNSQPMKSLKKNQWTTPLGLLGLIFTCD